MEGTVGLISHLIHPHSTHICLKPPFLTKVVGVSDYEIEQYWFIRSPYHYYILFGFDNIEASM